MIPHYTFSLPSWKGSTATGTLKRTTVAPLLGSSDRIHGPHTSIASFPSPAGGLSAFFLRQGGFSAFDTNVRPRARHPNVPFKPSAILPPLSSMPSNALSVLNSSLSFAKIRKGAGAEQKPSTRRLPFKGMFPKGGGMRDVGMGLGKLDEEGEIDKGLRSFMNPLLQPPRRSWKVFGKGSGGEEDEDGRSFRPFPGASIPPILTYITRRPLPIIPRHAPLARRDPRSGIGHDTSIFSPPKMNRFIHVGSREGKHGGEKRHVVSKKLSLPSPPPVASSSWVTAPPSPPPSEGAASDPFSLDGDDDDVIFSSNHSGYLKRVRTPKGPAPLYGSRLDGSSIEEVALPPGASALPSESYFCGVGEGTKEDDEPHANVHIDEKQKEETRKSAKGRSGGPPNGLFPPTPSSLSFPTSSQGGANVAFPAKTPLDAPQSEANDTPYGPFSPDMDRTGNPATATTTPASLPPLRPLSQGSTPSLTLPTSTYTSPPPPLPPLPTTVAEKEKKTRKIKKRKQKPVVKSDALDSSSFFISASPPSFDPFWNAHDGRGTTTMVSAVHADHSFSPDRKGVTDRKAFTEGAVHNNETGMVVASQNIRLTHAAHFTA